MAENVPFWDKQRSTYAVITIQSQRTTIFQLKIVESSNHENKQGEPEKPKE
jgi:hypothetical protein